MSFWVDSLAGSLGGIVATAVVYPLDVVRTKLQVDALA